MTRTLMILLLAATPMLVADGPPPSIRKWLIERPLAAQQSVEVALARASVRQVVRPGALRIEIAAHGSRGLETVRIEVEQSRAGVSISDVYRANAAVGAAIECVPPVGARGAFWASDVVFEVTIFVPAGARARIDVMDQRR